mmetsp:Transcript_41995/g.134068  ORF Transcript_41995/g.134068 Transcript_41995/m.134068 type:complete len:318 (-) Transcript_41995:137-1090(-)
MGLKYRAAEEEVAELGVLMGHLLDREHEVGIGAVAEEEAEGLGPGSAVVGISVVYVLAGDLVDGRAHLKWWAGSHSSDLDAVGNNGSVHAGPLEVPVVRQLLVHLAGVGPGEPLGWILLQRRHSGPRGRARGAGRPVACVVGRHAKRHRHASSRSHRVGHRERVAVLATPSREAEQPAGVVDGSVGELLHGRRCADLGDNAIDVLIGALGADKVARGGGSGPPSLLEAATPVVVATVGQLEGKLHVVRSRRRGLAPTDGGRSAYHPPRDGTVAEMRRCRRHGDSAQGDEPEQHAGLHSPAATSTRHGEGSSVPAANA